MREYILYDDFGGKITVKVKQDKDCIFCKHCTDVYWDYTNGIWGLVCELDREEINNEITHTCEKFEEGYDECR